MAKKFTGFEFKVPNLPKEVYRKMRDIAEYEGISTRTLVIAGHLAFMRLAKGQGDAEDIKKEIVVEAKEIADTV